jgi:hypothetical protein
VNILNVWKILLVPADQEESSCEYIEGKVTPFICPEVAGQLIPGLNLNGQLVYSLLKKQFVASDEKLVLKWLPGICNLGALMPDKILYLIAVTDLNAQYMHEKMPGHIRKPWGNLVSVNQ